MRPSAPAADHADYRRLREWGIAAVGDRLPPAAMARYRYHLDLGGWGGTTWTGTLEKLAPPGLLFHHVTPATDWFHDLLVPWAHYVPVWADLADLWARVVWAEAQPEAARRIAARGTAFARNCPLLNLR